MGVKMKVAVITGGARGIGKAIGLKLAAAGTEIAIMDIIDEGMQTSKEISSTHDVKANFYKVDISNYKQVEESVKKVLDDFEKIDIIVNNAGITQDSLLLRMQPQQWNKVLNVNLTGCFNCTKAVLKQMVSQRWGRIINISSVVGITGNFGQSNYSASKSGVIGFTKSVAKEVAKRNITVNVIAPGFIESDMTLSLPEKIKKSYIEQIPMKKMGKPIDIANTVAFLVSDEASYITGQVINVDGGMVM
jgi:3-oxoacyl-[acyl-carrier protein] reductase